MVERRTPERKVGVRSSLRSPCCVLEQDTFTSQKVLVIPRKRWLRPDMTEKLFTGTLSKNETKRNRQLCGFCSERLHLPLGAWDGLRYFIVTLREPSI